jgi:hypothetical protein
MHHLALCILPTRPAPYVCLCRGDHRSLRLAEVRHLAREQLEQARPPAVLL